MVQVTKQPTEGQFIRVWEYDGKLWSDVVRIVDGQATVYNDESDDFDSDFVEVENMHGCPGVMYIVQSKPS